MHNENCPLCSGEIKDDICTECGYAIPNIENLAAAYSLEPSERICDISIPQPMEITDVTHLSEEIYPNGYPGIEQSDDEVYPTDTYNIKRSILYSSDKIERDKLNPDTILKKRKPIKKLQKIICISVAVLLTAAIMVGIGVFIGKSISIEKPDDTQQSLTTERIIETETESDTAVVTVTEATENLKKHDEVQFNIDATLNFMYETIIFLILILASLAAIKFLINKIKGY